MEIVDRRARLTRIPISVLSGRPFPLKKCDHLGCEAIATEHCSGHGVHFCKRHFEQHKEEWHCGCWEEPMAVGQC
jgi:hypothetical protein